MVEGGPLARFGALLTEASSDDEIDTYIRKSVNTTFHICGSCKMGARDDPFAVCDEEARVYGVEGLRVVDCSLKPDCVRANLQFTVYMMAERIAAQMRHGGDLQAALQRVQDELAAVDARVARVLAAAGVARAAPAVRQGRVYFSGAGGARNTAALLAL